MSYQFENEKKNYEFLSSGRILQSYKGMPAFPVRLTLEILQRCIFDLKNDGILPPYSIYDPCCGGGYILSTIGLLSSSEIDTIYGSDIDEESLELAKKNLSLLSQEGLARRVAELEKLVKLYKKEAHQASLTYCKRFRECLVRTKQPTVSVFKRDILSDFSNTLVNANIIIVDTPYSKQSAWQIEHAAPLSTKSFQERFLTNLYQSLAEKGVASIIMCKSEKLSFPQFKVIKMFCIGKRRIYLLKK
jgi:23S rRNA (guanine2535-N1)-methyltransferase